MNFDHAEQYRLGAVRSRFVLLSTAFFVVTALLLGLSTRIPLEQWLGPLEAQRLGQMPLLLVRAACLAMLLIVAPVPTRRPRRPRRPRPPRTIRPPVIASGFAVAVVVVTVVVVCGAASFVWNVATLALVVVAVVSTAVLASRRAPAAATRTTAAASVAAALLALACGVVLAQRSPAHEPAPAHTGAADDRSLALSWEQRDNPFRALVHARAWAAAEGAPGEGALCIARLAVRLGDVEDARALLHVVVQQGASDGVRAEARALLARLGASP